MSSNKGVKSSRGGMWKKISSSQASGLPGPDSKSKPKPRLGPSAMKNQESNGSKTVRFRPLPRPTSKTVKSEVDLGLGLIDDTHLRLLEWAKHMGFMPHGKFTKASDYPPVEDIKKLCRDEMKPTWEHIMKCVRPKEEVAEIRRALAEKRRRDRTDNSDGLVHKSELVLRKESLERELAKKKNIAVESEICLKKLLSDWENQLYDIETIQHQIDQDKLKVNLFELKAEDVKQRVNVMEKYVDAAQLSLAGLKRGTANNEEHGANDGPRARANPKAVSSLRECLVHMETLHDDMYKKAYPQTRFFELGHAEKLQLQLFVQEHTDDLTAGEIWNVMLTLQDELCAQARETRNATLSKEDEDAESEIEDAEIQTHKLEALYIQVAADATATEKGNKTLMLQVEDAFHECWDLINQQLNTSANLNQTSAVVASLAEEWLEKGVLCARLEASNKELGRLVQETRGDVDRVEKTNRKYEATRLERKQRREKMGAMDQRVSYNIHLSGVLMENVHETRRAIHSTLADSTFADAVRRTERTTCRLKGVAGEEVREFSRLPLDAIDLVELPSGKKMLRSNLLINYTQGLPQLLNNSYETDLFSYLGGAPVSTIDDVVLRLHEKKIYGNRLRWALEDRKALNTKPVYDAAKFRKTENETNDKTWALLNRLKYNTEECEGAIKSLVESRTIYMHHPIQLAIREDVTEGNLTFAQWKQKYEKVYKKLDESRNEKC